MLQVIIDPSMLTGTKLKSNFPEIPGDPDYIPWNVEVTLNIAGTAWEVDTPLPNFPSKEDFKTCFYPWWWQDQQPTHIRIQWLKNSDLLIGLPELDIPIVDISPDNFELDKNLIQSYYESILDKKLINEDAIPLSFNEQDIKLSFTAVTRDTSLVLSIEGDKDNLDEIPLQAGYSGFLMNRICKFGQKLSPLNYFNNMAFFATLSDVPKLQEDPDAFIAYPICKDIAGKNRWKNSQVGGMVNQKYVITYDSVFPMELFCPITPVPKPRHPAEQSARMIEIRDDAGDFLGHTNIEVNDSDELFNREVFQQKLLQTVNHVFDIPGLFQQYLLSNLRLLTKIEDASWFDNTNQMLLSLLRDPYSLGHSSNKVTTEILLNGIELTNKDEEHPDLSKGLINQFISELKEQRLDIVIGREKLIADVIDRCNKVDYKAWREFFKSEELQLIETHLELIENGPGLKDEKSILDWLNCWEEMVSNNIPDIKESYTDKDWELYNKRVSMVNAKKSLFKIQIAVIVNEAIATAISERVPPQDYTPEKFAKENEYILESAKSVFKQTSDNFFAYYNPGNLFIEGIVRYQLSNDNQDVIARQFNDSTAPAIRTKLIGYYLLPYADKRAYPSQDKLIPELTTLQLEKFSTVGGFSWHPSVPIFEIPPASTFLDFILSIYGDDDHAYSKALDREIDSLLKRPTDVPPKVLIKVDDMESGDDLSDEIAGHLLLIKREKDIGQKNYDMVEWKALNWTRININSKEKDPVHFDNDYLLPAFLPASDAENIRNTYLSLDNERLSLIAGGDSFNDGDDNPADYDAEHTFSYLFEQDIEGEEGRKIPPAYALWYGYYYLFAGFVALNSGVLPRVLRGENELQNNWIKPVIGNNKIDKAKPYQHLRRVPFSKVSTRISQNNRKQLVAVPAGLNLLAAELISAPGQQDYHTSRISADRGNDHQIYLLSDYQEKIELELGKPLTNLWNWYAWLGDKLANHQSGLDFQNQVFAADYANRCKPAKDRIPIAFLHDPALENRFYIAVEEIFPSVSDATSVNTYFIINLEETKTEKGIVKNVKNELVKININSAVSKITVHAPTGGDQHFIVSVPPGHVAKISIHCLVDEKYFKKDSDRFHSWMKDEVTVNTRHEGVPDGFLLTHPAELIFEAAIKPSAIKTAIDPLHLWQSMLPDLTANQQIVLDLVKDVYQFSYYSRVRTNHQVWYWSGRLSKNLLGGLKTEELDEFPENINPVEGKTNYAMNWEAWEFSDRPDLSALEYTAFLKAVRPGQTLNRQTIFTDNRAVDEKALYYRFSVDLFGRYELLGGDYEGSVKSGLSVDGIVSTWKRFVKLSTRKNKLPKPVIRFVIPLTASIDECRKPDTVASADLMIVLNDRWFSEAGLAEKLEVGIDLLRHEKQNGDERVVEYYPNIGHDPILSGKGTGALSIDKASPDTTYAGQSSNPDEYYIERPDEEKYEWERKNPVVVFTPNGPAGLTFDLATATPRLIGSTFILKINDVNRFVDTDKTQLGPWAMIQIAVRKNMFKQLCEFDDYDFRSEWTAKEWVQFLPDISSLVPVAWRKESANFGHVNFKMNGDRLEPVNRNFEFPIFSAGQAQDKSLDNESSSEQRMERYLVISERMYNAGGQPVEVYRATYRYDKVDGNFMFNDATDGLGLKQIKQGYLRVILVRVRAKGSDQNLWEMLFGKYKDEEVKFNEVLDDPKAALPLISKRLSIEII